MSNKVREWFAWHDLRQHVLAPIWLRVPEKWRWEVVHHLDKSERQCWADLVSDALASPEEDPCDVSLPRLLGERSPRCATTCDWFGHTGEHDCSCYCGKFRFLATEGGDERRGRQR